MMAKPETLEPSRSMMVVVDMQARLAPAIGGFDGIVERNLLLIAAARRLQIPIVLTEQYSKGLGVTLEFVASAAGGAPVFAKSCFDACAEVGGVADHCAELDRRQLLVTGCETHVCVMQTVFGLLSRGNSVFVVADAVGSRRAIDRSLALERMKDAGARLVTTEMAVFEWLGTAQHPAFRDLLPGIRALSPGR